MICTTRKKIVNQTIGVYLNVETEDIFLCIICRFCFETIDCY